MWRQALVDGPFQHRLRAALFGAVLRGSWLSLAALLVVGIVLAVLSLQSGSWPIALAILLMIAAWPLLLWNNVSRSISRLPVGSLVGYAVTPDGTLHTSTAVGTATINPGFVSRLGATPELWLVVAGGQLIPIPRELLPDPEAALLVRHLPGRFSAPAARRG